MTMNQTLDFPKNMFMDHAYRPHPLNDIVQLMSQSEHKGPHFRSMVKDGDMDNDVLQRRWCDIIILIMLLELGFSYHLKGMYRWMTRKPPSRSCGSCCWSFSLWCAHHLIFFPRSWSSWLYHLFFFTTHPWILVWDQCHAPKHLVERHIFAFRQTFYPEFSTRLAPSNLHGTPKWDPQDNSSIGNSKVCQFRVFFKGCTSPFVDKHQLVSLPFFTSFLSELAVSLHFMLFKIAQNWIWIRYPQNMTRSLKMIPWSYPKPPDLPS